MVTAVVLACSGCLTGSNNGGPAPVAARESSGATVPITVSITSPDAAAIDTIDETIDLEGSAAGTAIASVAWENSAGGNGQASGTQAWQAANVPLEPGVNTITVRATDEESNVAEDVIVVNRESELAGSATLSWDAPTERADGTTLTNLAGYRIYYGRMSEIYDYEVEIDNAGLSTFTVQNLSPGDWFFSVTAYDAEGNESKASNEATTKIL